LFVIQDIFTKPRLAFVRNELLLSAAAGAVLFVLPPLVFYVRRALAAGGK
jgi:hypothetical protein